MKLGVSRAVGNGATEIGSSSTLGLDFLKRRGRGVAGIDDSSMSNLGVLKRVEGPVRGVDGSSRAGLGLSIDNFEVDVEPRGDGISDVIRRVKGKRSVGD